jgi:hypothetical protein
VRARLSVISVGVVLAAVLGRVATVKAQDANATTAEALFREGKQLLEKNDFAQACPKLAASYRLDPATGALLALAVCYERAGKLASAWATYSAVAARSKAEGRGDRERAARERVLALEPRLATLTIAVPAASDLPGLRVTRDGEEVARAALGVPVPVDAGAHEIEATAPGRKPWKTALAVAQTALAGERKSIDVPVLELAPLPAPLPLPGVDDALIGPAPAPAPVPVPSPPTAAPLPDSRPGDPAAADPAPPAPGPEARARRRFTGTQIAGLGTAGAGLVALGVAGGFALVALDKKQDYESRSDCALDCPDLRAANSAGNWATVFSVGGLVLGAAGLTMFLVGREPPGSGAVAVGVAPGPAGQGWRLSLGGRF